MPDRENLTPVGFRLPDDLIARIDAYRAQVERTMPCVRMSRSNAIRVLEAAHAAEGLPAEQPAAKAKRGK